VVLSENLEAEKNTFTTGASLLYYKMASSHFVIRGKTAVFQAFLPVKRELQQSSLAYGNLLLLDDLNPLQRSRSSRKTILLLVFRLLIPGEREKLESSCETT
jgi:hypothetical protein